MSKDELDALEGKGTGKMLSKGKNIILSHEDRLFVAYLTTYLNYPHLSAEQTLDRAINLVDNFSKSVHLRKGRKDEERPLQPNNDDREQNQGDTD